MVKVIKKTTIGLETEFFTLDSEGNLVNRADDILNKFSENEKLKKHMSKEVSKSMFEMMSNPNEKVSGLYSNYLKEFQKVLEYSEEKGIHLLPIGCYPGKSKPKIREEPWYKTREYLIGKKNLHYIMKVCGFHFHYSLPKGLIEKGSNNIKRITTSGIKDLFLNVYNLSVALEPACMTFCQSSPFLEGKNYGKDSRTLAYRDISIPDSIYGIYERLPLFGGLPQYQFTLEDLRDMSTKRKNLYLDMLRENNFPTNEIVTYSDLRFMAGPIRVNKIGTLEFRGFDMNYPSYLLAISKIIRYTLEGIEKNNLKVLPSDIGISEPFKLEDETVYVAPFSIVKSIELLSSRFGFENSAVYDYCSKFVELAKKVSNKKAKDQFKKIEEILEQKKTMSDKIIELAKKNGWEEEQEIDPELSKYIASYISNGLKKDIEETNKKIEKLSI